MLSAGKKQARPELRVGESNSGDVGVFPTMENCGTSWLNDNTRRDSEDEGSEGVTAVIWIEPEEGRIVWGMAGWATAMDGRPAGVTRTASTASADSARDGLCRCLIAKLSERL
jgi:hypothetical protein